MSNNEINNIVFSNSINTSNFHANKNNDDNKILQKSASDHADCVGINLINTAKIVENKNNIQLRKIGSVTKKLFSCVMCQQKFTKHDLLLIHFRKHGSNEIDLKGRPIGELPTNLNSGKPACLELIECEWCPEAFATISKAIEHKFRKHKYESINYFCKLCGKLFPLKFTLNQHMKNEHKINETTEAESNINPLNANIQLPMEIYNCRYCDVSFETQNALDFHEKCVHGLQQKLLMPTAVPPPSKKIRMTNSNEASSLYYCHLCGTEYMIKYNLQKHLVDCHPDEEAADVLPVTDIIKCKACESIFYNENAFNNHNRYHNPDDLYITSEEQRQRVVSRVDQDYDVRRVRLPVEKCISSKKKN